ncbi:PREDICTED: uncharacterized protein LOC108616771 [Drosophila arizonae]|uniref:Uncharacterized protein LOC108616771 n=1 Tax=Drosophila arizonae TaxID=7263 RepID=A0ABM1PKE6_DROAR|nr:PREDICTED: uncharacterized protein LOC108616771 [Drosophila arizonae]
MPYHPKWYRLSFCDSLTSPNDYVIRKISNGSHEVRQAFKYTETFFEVPTSSVAPSPKKVRRPRAKKSKPKAEKPNEVLEEDERFEIKQCPALNRFERELRYRELKRYYAKLIESERSADKTYARTCPNCGLVKSRKVHKDISKNVYCSGPDTMLQNENRAI